jgi:hypothetical protein
MNVMQGLNRRTKWLAVGLLSFASVAALLVDLEEFEPKVADYANEESHSNAYAPRDAIPSTPSNAFASNAARSTSWISLPYGDKSSRVLGAKKLNLRINSSARSKSVPSKASSISFWHRSLPGRHPTRTWTLFWP